MIVHLPRVLNNNIHKVIIKRNMDTNIEEDDAWKQF